MVQEAVLRSKGDARNAHGVFIVQLDGHTPEIKRHILEAPCQYMWCAAGMFACARHLLERLRKDHGENAIVSVRYFIHNEADGTERAQPWNKNKSRAEAMLRRQYHGAGSRCFHG